MIIKLPEVQIGENDVFQHDKLNRRVTANMLKSMVNCCDNGGVIALNGAWGTGKTTFLRLWQEMLKREDYQTIYFNSWESDYVSEPFVALIANIIEILPNESKAKDNIIKTGAHVAFSLVDCAANALSIKLKETCDDIKEAFAKTFSDEVTQFMEQSRSLEKFRQALRQIVSERKNHNPIVFIIDELDRCAPSYAVKLLERIKHLFSIEGIVFVLAIDKEQLANSIKGYYGSEAIDSQEYLRRFIDIDCTLPRPNYKDFCNYIFNSLDMQQCFKRGQEVREDGTSLNIIAELVSNANGLTLRQLEKMYVASIMILKASYDYSVKDVDLNFILLFIQLTNTPFYENIKNHTLSLQAYVNGLEDCLETIIIRDNDELSHLSVYTRVALLIMAYNQRNKDSASAYHNYPPLWKGDKNQELTFTVSKLNQEYLLKELVSYQNYNRSWSIDTLIDNVEMVRGFVYNN